MAIFLMGKLRRLFSPPARRQACFKMWPHRGLIIESTDFYNGERTSGLPRPAHRKRTLDPGSGLSIEQRCDMNLRGRVGNVLTVVRGGRMQNHLQTHQIRERALETIRGLTQALPPS